MAIRKCRDCKKDVSTGAPTCPNCGRKNPTDLVPKSGKIMFLLFLWAGIYMVFSIALEDTVPNRSKEGPSHEKVSEISVTAKKLLKDYKANEVRADSKYKGKRIQITGNVASIDKSAWGDLVVRLEAGDFLDDVRVTLAENQEGFATKLNKGDNVAISCVGTGMILGSPTCSAE